MEVNPMRVEKFLWWYFVIGGILRDEYNWSTVFSSQEFEQAIFILYN